MRLGENAARFDRSRAAGRRPADPPEHWTAPRAYLAELATKAPRSGAPDPRQEMDLDATARQVAAGDALVDIFSTRARQAGAHVETSSSSEAVAKLLAALREASAESILIEPMADTPFDASLADELSRGACDAGMRAHRRPLDDDALFALGAAVTGATWAIAESGSLLVECGPQSRGASLVPPTHICVVGVSQLLPDLIDAFAAYSESRPLPANLNLITGPSKTADIEGVLVTGMHGPGRLVILLLLDR